MTEGMTLVNCDNLACKSNQGGVCTNDEVTLNVEYQHEFTCADNTALED